MGKILRLPALPGPIFFLIASCLLPLPQVSAFSSGRISADSASVQQQQRNHHHHQHHVGLFSSEEAGAGTDELINELRHEITDSRTGGGGGLHSMSDVMRNVATVAEEMAEEAVKKCHTMQVAIDYDSLVSDY